jgi:transmembrane protein TMEM260 (protein O-mannosyltransferase)
MAVLTHVDKPQRGAAMALPTDDRPPYGLAVLAFFTVLAGYVVSLAPTVTFWDAGEFIASSHIYGIPHPPGTPVFVTLGRVWDMLIPGLTTAVKTNLMSATFSAGCAAFFFLFMHEALRRGSEDLDEGTARLFRVGGAFSATLIAAFLFTVWQNSNETEVYQVAMFSIGLIAWLSWLWRRDRGGVNGSHVLLLTVYVLGVTLGNHLMALLCGPAVFAFMFHVLWSDPSKAPAERNMQWAEFAVAGALWVTLVGVGVGSKFIVVAGLALYLVAAAWCIMAGSWLFAIMALLVAAVGASTYLILYIRAGLHPFISEADPSTLDNLWAVIRREQYPPRSPLDDPTVPSGPDNPGRTLQILFLQVMNYLQYFNWQFAAALQKGDPVLGVLRMPFTVIFGILGMLGLREHHRWDRSSFWFIAGLFLTTSVGLILYLNFKPGFSIGYGWFPDRELHEVRERDYFYTVSYYAWGLWAGLGLAVVYRALRERLASGPAIAASPVLAVAMLPFALNFAAAGRHHLVTATLPRDFAYDMLIGVEPYGLLFTNGDNDTFPLWYLQEVEGVRQDVMVVNLSLINTDWYIRQLRDNPARPYRPDSNALRLFGPRAGPPPSCSAAQLQQVNEWARAAHRRPPDLAFGRPMCLHTLNDDAIANMQPQLIPNDLNFRAGNIQHRYQAGTPMYVKDIMVLRLIQENLGRRPIYFALTAGGANRMALDRYMVQQGLAFKLTPDTVTFDSNVVDGRSIWGTSVGFDIARTQTLVGSVYRYARLFQVDSLELEPTDDNIAGNLSIVYTGLGLALRDRGRLQDMVEAFRKADHLSPNPQLREFLRSISALPLPSGDSGRAAPDTAKQAGRSPPAAPAARRDTGRR